MRSLVIRACVNFLDYPSSRCEFSTAIVLRSRERFLVTVTVLVGDAGIDSIAFQILLLVSMVTTLVELSIMYPPRAL